jgi:type II secretory pathway predicted ATPase ExeA
VSRPVKVTPDVMARVKQLRGVGHSHREVAAILSLSITTVKSVCSGSYANGFLHRAKNPHTVLNASTNTSVATDAKKRATALKTVRAKKLAPEVSHTPEAVPSTPTATEEKEDPMLLQNQALSPEARQHFKLPRNPFVDDVQSPDDVFQSPSVRYVRAALLDCAQHHGFVAVVGESGAGKSTLAEDLEERIKMDKRNVLVVRPYVLAMEANDTKGKTLKSGAIAESIAYALDPHVSLRSSPQARFAQVHNLLKASRSGGRRHLLLIEEAHCLPLATLKHLKRFLELKDGMQRLIGIALIGQPELRERLGSQNAEVREVAQRCELVALDPLDAELEAYLQHKFARFELKLSDVFAADAFDAMRARLIHLPRGGRPSDARSLCYPLVVNNLVCRAMNAAAAAHWPQVDAQVVKGC